jgi:hypothetical protein
VYLLHKYYRNNNLCILFTNNLQKHESFLYSVPKLFQKHKKFNIWRTNTPEKEITIFSTKNIPENNRTEILSRMRPIHLLFACLPPSYSSKSVKFLLHQGAYTPTESSRVQSSPVRLTKTQQRLCGLLTMAAAAVRTHQQSRVESSYTSLAE